MKDDKKKNAEAARQKMIANQWREFSKLDAYKDFIKYIEFQDYLAVSAAKGPINTFVDESGAESVFPLEKTAYLLQRSVGYDIVRTYVDGYVNPTTL